MAPLGIKTSNYRLCSVRGWTGQGITAFKGNVFVVETLGLVSTLKTNCRIGLGIFGGFWRRKQHKYVFLLLCLTDVSGPDQGCRKLGVHGLMLQFQLYYWCTVPAQNS